MDTKLRQKLDELGWTAAEFARKTGIHPTTVSRWKNVPLWAYAFCDMALKVKRLWHQL